MFRRISPREADERIIKEFKLNMVYSKETSFIKELLNPNKCYVYLLVYSIGTPFYYVGSSIDLRRRINNHLKADKLGYKKQGKFYILEEFEKDDDKRLRDIETLWIKWFWINAGMRCDNKVGRVEKYMNYYDKEYNFKYETDDLTRGSNYDKLNSLGVIKPFYDI